MANERNTENLVRNMLRNKGYSDNSNILIEEQQSTSPKINKLLKNASKGGKGKGYPEFIITFVDNPNDLIVIECKASVSKHESEKKNNAKDYAVDGVLLYAEHLKDQFNVTAIAVSGETDKEKKISTFLWLKEHYTYTSIQDRVFLSHSEISDIIIEQQTPISEDQLIKKAIEYNDELHGYSIPEVERCTLVSSILVALQDKPFISSYRHFGSEGNRGLIDSLYSACERVLKTNKLSQNKVDVILSEYKKFQHNKIFTSSVVKKRKNTVLRDLIDSFNREILPYIKQNHFDVLGKFYTQFIRYAGSDSKTGLVLTPGHITDFFCDVADLSDSDVVFDPCCGTAGFLVSAMNSMLHKAEHLKEKQKEIKSKQLIGIEQRNDMFSHSCSNMMMRGDGKSQIHNGDCFDKNLKDIVKKAKPNVSFLNPPYQDRNADKQLEFIENALECITKNGTCVAICQMSTVVGSNKSIIEVKKRLLEKHTLKAVFSMPDDLFHPIGVVTCILVFNAKNPHPENKESFFGYFKDDGFIKRKHKGRVDHKGQWLTIKEKWLDAYTNNKNIAGLSVTQKVTAEDEWCAEAYMETDYSTLTDDDFIKTIKEYVAFQFLSGRGGNEIS